MSGAQRRPQGGGRWHFQHGPIDCIVFAEGEPKAVAAALERAWARFTGVLDELVGELPLLRADLGAPAGRAVAPRGPVARRMVAACRPHAAGGRFITAMAAVAGSVADELIGCFDDARIGRAFVNNGGDIALRLRDGEAFDLGVVADPDRALEAGPCHPERSQGSRRLPFPDGRFRIDSSSPVRGVATSGWRGRSFSLGIADAATVLAPTAALADAAATVLGNAVDVDTPGIVRRPASALRDDSDLGDRLVTTAVPPLSPADVGAALARGVEQARAEIAAGRIVAALLSLQGRWRVCGEPVPAVTEECIAC